MKTLKPIPAIPKVAKPRGKATPKKSIEEVRPQIKLYALMQNIEQYQDDKEELLNIIRLINETRHCKLVTPQLLTQLDIDVKTDPNLFTNDELVKIIIFLHDAVIQKEAGFINASPSYIFEKWYGLMTHAIHYSDPKGVVMKTGEKPLYTHTISQGYDDKDLAESMVCYLYSMKEQYGIKAVGYRTEGHHTTGDYEIKIWCSQTHWQQQQELLTSLSQEEEGREERH